jgi:hypothetical protein
MRAKFINEFERGLDPLETLGIGIKNDIKKGIDKLQQVNGVGAISFKEPNLFTWRRWHTSDGTSAKFLPDNTIDNKYFENVPKEKPNKYNIPYKQAYTNITNHLFIKQEYVNIFRELLEDYYPI